MTIEPEETCRMYDIESQPKGGMISETEIEILRFVNEFGFCEINQIMKRFDIKKSAAYLSMQLLIRLGLMVQARIIQSRRGAYIVTHKGIALLELDLPRVKKISLVTYVHHLAVIDVHLKLKEFYPNAAWISERRLVREKNESGCRKNVHLPDGVLVFPDGNKYAIEVERTPKTKSRLEELLLGYGLQDIYKEVWYFCSPHIFYATRGISKSMPYVKTYNLAEYTA